MRKYLAVCGDCQYRQNNGYCLVQGAVKRENQILCGHFKMLEEHTVNREERIGIMTESGLTEKQAHKYCNSQTKIYGFVRI